MPALTPETIAVSASSVNVDGARGPVRVTAASTTRRGNGDLVLFLRTEVGPGTLVFSPALAKQLFVVTNPGAPEARAKCASDGESSAPRVTHLSPERLAAYEAIEREVATDPREWGAVSRACARHGIETKSFFSWRHKRRDRASADAANAEPTREPIAKPSGELL